MPDAKHRVGNLSWAAFLIPIESTPVVNTFRPYTPQAKNVLLLALDIAHQFHARTLDADHLLLALLRGLEGTGIAVLRQAEIDPEQLCLAIDRRAWLLPRGRATPNPGRLPFLRGLPYSRSMEITIERTMAEVVRFRHRRIGTGHLVLGLLTETNGSAGPALQSVGIKDLARLRRQIEDALVGTSAIEPVT